uniref:Late Transcription Factor Vltf3 n=1 Tax=Florenciella sp. virus SA2 TaxID=3240092 RepID=A0AB39J9X4_9VIRU
MSQKLEETLCNLFIDIQLPYSKYCPSDRVNFLNYYYTLYKLCELLGETKYLRSFSNVERAKENRTRRNMEKNM